MFFHIKCNYGLPKNKPIIFGFQSEITSKGEITL